MATKETGSKKSESVEATPPDFQCAEEDAGIPYVLGGETEGRRRGRIYRHWCDA